MLITNQNKQTGIITVRINGNISLNGLVEGENRGPESLYMKTMIDSKYASGQHVYEADNDRQQVYEPKSGIR